MSQTTIAKIIVYEETSAVVKLRSKSSLAPLDGPA
eukprot:CAMPEP_0119406732 /NCGR_PEP_ID=MMETSP1335-20130426/947_1 /TAXON_ID=259385 /ORGANISM="Chrysoculter rhomboideus, Strain RCC1486" /LENGTH=34 /DNA_ID= /DNA_START= /DNA_END= /DNA_ORIENTATION=